MPKLPVLAHIFAVLVLICLPSFSFATNEVPARLMGPSMPFLPYCQYLLATDETLDITEAAALQHADDYRPVALKDLPRHGGGIWLRFILSPTQEKGSTGIRLLDMGQSVPGTPVLYEPVYNPLSGAQEWRESTPAQRNILLMPETGTERLTCYIHLDGLPGPWFAPVLRSPHDAATNLDNMAHSAAILALGVVMLLCLLRSLSESGQWRIWTALFVAVALLQGMIGIPASATGQFSLSDLADVLAPGMALMLLPHVGRHLMRTPERSRALDIQLSLLSLPGAVLALLPLVPGYAWLCRFLDLWPLGTVLFLPTAIGACLMGLGGSKRFLLGCILPPLFVCGGLLGLESGLPANILASAPLWGVALSALLIAATRAPHPPADEDKELTEKNSEDKGSGILPPAAEKDSDTVSPLEHPMNDPALRLIPAVTSPEPIPTALPVEELSPAFWEAALQEPLDDILRNGVALEHCALSPAVRSHTEGMLDAARRLAEIISSPDKAHVGDNDSEPAGAFNLQHLMREVHDAMVPVAESAGIGLAWYMPPYLGQMYEGRAASLATTLRLLLESAVRATQQGAVHFSVRPKPDCNNAGHLLFTVTDSGTGIPPHGRSMQAISRAWEAAGRYGGSLDVEYGPKGTTIAFTVCLRSLDQPRSENETQPEQTSLPLLLIVAPQARDRQDVIQMLAGRPCRCEEASDLAEALPKVISFVPLVIVRGPEAVPESAPLLLQLELRNSVYSTLPGKVLAITPDDSQWSILGDAGFTHALQEPIDATDLRQTVEKILQATVETSKQSPDRQKAAGSPPLPDLFGSSERGSSPQRLPDMPHTTEDLRRATPAAAAAEQTQQEHTTRQTEKTLTPGLSIKPEPDGPSDILSASTAPKDAPEASSKAACATVPDAVVEELVAQVEFAPKSKQTVPSDEGPEQVRTASEEKTEPISVRPEPQGPLDTEPRSVEQPESIAKANLILTAPLSKTPTADSAAQHEPAPAEPVQNDLADDFVDWVGEPMPLGTATVPASQPKNIVQPTAKPQTVTPTPMSQPQSTGTANATNSKTRQYTSPSLSVPGEWVGEPMPIDRPSNPVPKNAVKQGHPVKHSPTVRPTTKAASATTSSPMPHKENRTQSPQTSRSVTDTVSSPEKIPAPAADSIMDFIASAEPVKKDPPPLTALVGEVNRPAPVQKFTPVPPPDRLETSESRPSPTVPKAEETMPPLMTPPGADKTIQELVQRLDAAMDEARHAFETRRALQVARAAGRIAAESDAFGFRVLARMARCVESAAKANDMTALKDLLPELAVAVERNRIALSPRS